MSKQAHSQNRKTGPISGHASLVNEGEPIPVVILDELSNSEGIQSARIELKLNSANAPRRRFTADAFVVLPRDDSYHLIFLQRRVNGSEIRAMVDIQMTIDSAVDFANSLVIATSNAGYASSFEIETLQEPEQVVTLSANYVRAASGPSGACIDFFLASPYSLAEGLHTKQLYLEGEVRIMTSPYVYEGFMRVLLDATKSPNKPLDPDVGFEQKVKK